MRHTNLDPTEHVNQRVVTQQQISLIEHMKTISTNLTDDLNQLLSCLASGTFKIVEWDPGKYLRLIKFHSILYKARQQK